MDCSVMLYVLSVVVMGILCCVLYISMEKVKVLMVVFKVVLLLVLMRFGSIFVYVFL